VLEDLQTVNFFSLNGRSVAKFEVQVLLDCNIYLVCRDFGHDEEIKFDAKFWIEYSDSKFGELVRSCVLEKAGNVTHSEDFVTLNTYNALKAQPQDGAATICFEIQQEVPVHEVNDEKFEVDFHENIGDAILSLHDDSTLVTIKAEEKEIKILKRLLIHHSEIFEKMFTMSSSIEAQSGIIKIESVSANVVEAMRNWMYMTKIDNFDEIAPSLFQIAHKYIIVKLKEKCVHSMCRGLTWENVPSRLILAHKYSEDLLKQCILEFVRNDRDNLHFLMVSDDWMKLGGDDPEMVKEIVASIYSEFESASIHSEFQSASIHSEVEYE